MKYTPQAPSILNESGIILSKNRNQKKTIREILPAYLDLNRPEQKKSNDQINDVPTPEV